MHRVLGHEVGKGKYDERKHAEKYECKQSPNPKERVHLVLYISRNFDITKLALFLHWTIRGRRD